jgi:fatty-acyl-CoA synthase
MHSTMMDDYPLTLPHILERAGRLFPDVELVARLPDRSLARSTYGAIHRRARALAEALQRAGLRRGEPVATLMWNHLEHVEAYFGIPAAGGVLHTLNLRLHPDDLAAIAHDAGDRILIVDDVLLPLFEKFAERAPFERIFVVPHTGRPVSAPYESYEALLATATGEFAYPALDEREPAGMCYTSGTTGQAKGVVYSHRSIVLHSLASSSAGMLGIRQRDVLMPVVPMFHVNAWGLPFTATMGGVKQVLPGPHLDGVSLLELFAGERVTVAAGVPTLWLNVLHAMETTPDAATRWPLVPGLRLIVGGAAAPESMIRAFDRHGVEVLHAWGMTEMSPIGTVCHMKSTMSDLPEETRYAVRATQGLPAPFVDVRAVGDEGEVPWDGVTMGELQVRGPWIAREYHQRPDAADHWTDDGWFRTGDIVTINREGYVKITDRAKDLIKSGGEWISSVDLENALMGHASVREAAVIAIPHPKWQERPLAVVVLKPGAEATPEELRAFLAPRFPTWWLPDDVIFVDEIPKTGAGKFLKRALRERFAVAALVPAGVPPAIPTRAAHADRGAAG